MPFHPGWVSSDPLTASMEPEEAPPRGRRSVFLPAHPMLLDSPLPSHTETSALLGPSLPAPGATLPALLGPQPVVITENSAWVSGLLASPSGGCTGLHPVPPRRRGGPPALSLPAGWGGASLSLSGCVLAAWSLSLGLFEAALLGVPEGGFLGP